MTKTHTFRHLDLFSGIGGFALAASWVWGEQHEIVSFCEIEKFPRKVLKKHWPDVPIHDDVKTLKGDQFGNIDLISGGFPCQPYSTAGRRKGSKDDRALWPEMLRVIKEAKPNWVVGENVAGFVSMGLDDCLSDLESAGYETTAFIIPACAVNAHHRRDRTWILGSNSKRMRGTQQTGKHELAEVINGSGENKMVARQTLADTSSKRSQRFGHSGESSGEFKGCTIARGSCQENTLSNSDQIRRGRVQQQPGVFQQADKTCSNVAGCPWPQGRKDPIGATWKVEPAVGRVADGIPFRVDRIKGLGNAIVPQVVVPIFECIKLIDEQTRQG